MKHSIHRGVPLIKWLAVAACLFGSSMAHAYTMSSKAKGSCPSGYYRAVTDPADVPSNYNKKVKEYYFPSNVCLRRSKDTGIHSKDNFSVSDFILIKNGDLKPFANVKFKWSSYEPVVGHYNTSTMNYTGSTMARSPYYGDFSGAHPFLISKLANAAIKMKDGLYLIDKQTVVKNYDSFARCPSGYSTIADSSTCYSQTNGLRLNSYDRLELFELGSYTEYVSGQECPMGLARASLLGSDRGICTSVKAIYNGISKFGLTQVQGACPGGEYQFRDGICMPQLTAVYCQMDSSSRSSFSYRYSSGRHAYIWPTILVNRNNSLVEFGDHVDWVSTGSIAPSALRKYANFFANDEAFFTISAQEKAAIPVFHLFSRQSCKDIWDNGGWSVDPVPIMW